MAAKNTERLQQMLYGMLEKKKAAEMQEQARAADFQRQLVRDQHNARLQQSIKREDLIWETRFGQKKKEFEDRQPLNIIKDIGPSGSVAAFTQDEGAKRDFSNALIGSGLNSVKRVNGVPVESKKEMEARAANLTRLGREIVSGQAAARGEEFEDLREETQEGVRDAREVRQEEARYQRNKADEAARDVRELQQEIAREKRRAAAEELVRNAKRELDDSRVRELTPAQFDKAATRFENAETAMSVISGLEELAKKTPGLFGIQGYFASRYREGKGMVSDIGYGPVIDEAERGFLDEADAEMLNHYNKANLDAVSREEFFLAYMMARVEYGSGRLPVKVIDEWRSMINLQGFVTVDKVRSTLKSMRRKQEVVREKALKRMKTLAPRSYDAYSKQATKGMPDEKVGDVKTFQEIMDDVETNGTEVTP